MIKAFQKDEPVIYRMPKHSKNPGKRARQITASRYGEDYHYCVDKYWVVDEVYSDGRIRIRTRRGKTRLLEPNDQNLRSAHWWERVLLASRFPKKVEESTASNAANSAS